MAQDTSISAPVDTSDEMSADAEFPVSIDTLMIDGTRPAVGDNVEVKVGGQVTRLVNDIAYVKPVTVNDQPLPAPVMEPNDMTSEGDRLQSLSKTYGGLSGDY